MTGAERSLWPKGTIRSERSVGAEWTGRTCLSALRGGMGLGPMLVGRPGLMPGLLSRLRLSRLSLGRMHLVAAGLSGPGRGRGIRTLGQEHHQQRNDGAGEEETEGGRYPGIALLRWHV
jgi:hypothetical protein